jgi:O-antigen ligase/tetratricopeptide (TPR) repeat protein
MNKLSFPLFLLTLIFAPLAFGSVETWSIGIVEVLVFSSLIFFIIEDRGKKSFLHIPGITPLLLLLFYIFLQLIPLPANIVNFLAPKIYEAYAPILDLQEKQAWIPLTVNQKSTLLEFIRISCYAGFYILTVQLLSQKDKLLKTVRIVSFMAIAIAFFAILQKISSPDAIYWFRPAPDGSSPGGPWVYRNHYAGFMELVFPLVLALFFYYRPKFDEAQSFRVRTASFFSAPGSNLYFVLGFGVVLILSSVFINLSRGGTIAINLGLFLFLAILTRKRNRSGKLLFLLTIGVVFLAVSWMGWDPILARFNATVTETGGIEDGRLMIWQDCAPIIRNFLFTGSGFETFIHVFPSYSTIPENLLFDHAHNDYIELLTDGGLIGFGLVAWFVLAVLKNGFKMLGKRRDNYSILLLTAGITAIFSLLFHSLTDFNMHNGANGLYFFFICGILISAGNTRLHFRERPTLLKSSSPKLRYVCLAGLPLLMLTVVLQGGIIKGRKELSEAEKIYVTPQLSAKLFAQQHAKIDKAISYDPLEGYYSYYKGSLFSSQQISDAAKKEYLEASLKNPFEGAYLQRLGLSLPSENSDKATKLMAEGYLRSHNKEKLVFTWVEWLLQEDRTEEAARALQQGIGQFPNLASNLPPVLLGNNFSREAIVSILPEKMSAWVQLGKFAEEMGRLEDAEYFRLHALDFLEHEKKIRPGHFIQIYKFYKKQKQADEAADILRRGIAHLPNYPPFHIYLGDYYKQKDIPYRAMEEYQQALLLEPGNRNIQSRIRRLQDR